jgi:hypothetical protein
MRGVALIFAANRQAQPNPGSSGGHAVARSFGPPQFDACHHLQRATMSDTIAAAPIVNTGAIGAVSPASFPLAA